MTFGKSIMGLKTTGTFGFANGVQRKESFIPKERRIQFLKDVTLPENFIKRQELVQLILSTNSGNIENVFEEIMS